MPRPDDLSLPTALVPLTDSAHGLTVRDVARRYRVSPDRVRAWIRSGELRAISTATATCGRPRFVVTPEALAEFERGHAVIPPPKPVRQRRRPAQIDYFPD
jgi:hypothetical protein